VSPELRTRCEAVPEEKWVEIAAREREVVHVAEVEFTRNATVSKVPTLDGGRLPDRSYGTHPIIPARWRRRGLRVAPRPRVF